MVVGVEVLVDVVALVAAFIGGYAAKFYLVRRKAKMDSKIYNPDGTVNYQGVLETIFGTNKDKVVAALKEEIKK